jgi:hypothetical protein
MFFSGCEIIENLNKKNIFIICKKPGVFRIKPLGTLFFKKGRVFNTVMDTCCIYKRLSVFM